MKRSRLIRLCVVLAMVFAAVGAAAKTPIMGKSKVKASHIAAFIREHNPDFPEEIAEAYIAVGERYGVRGDIDLCQAILETGWFRFTGGTAVTLEQNNFCGLGVTSLGVKGHSFETIEEGVTAQIQHLYAYAGDDGLPDGAGIVDPRFHLVKRGSARTWESLSGRWAANPHYGNNILALYKKLRHYKPGKK